MVELAPEFQVHAGARLGWEQFRAIAWLRWRIFANGFRRKGGTAELIGRILLLPLLGSLVLLPAGLAGFFAWRLAVLGTLGQLPLVLWAAFGLTQLLNINLGQPGTTFDPTELIRFPLPLRDYVLVRLCFGLLSPANVAVTLMSFAVFVGLTLARPRLWLWTLLATVAFGLANVLFSRMIFAWVDRWLSTRRAREAFTGLIFAASLLFQYLNVTYNPGFQSSHARAVRPANLHRAQALESRLHPWLRWLPPELTGAAVLSAEHREFPSSLARDGLVFLYAAGFLLVYASRMRTEYRGENLSDVANAVRTTPRRPAIAPAGTAAGATGTRALALSHPAASLRPSGLLPASLGPLLGKELLVMRRNTGLLYGVVAPTVMVFLFAGRLSLRGGSQWLLLLAVGYALLGLAPMSYNSFGLEGPGSQFYFMAPVPLREVFFAKNFMQFLLALFEVCAVIAIVAYVAGRPHVDNMLFVLLWAAATLLLNTTLGNLRSIAAPKKINPGKSLNRAQSQVSAWIAIGVLVGCMALGASFQFLGVYLHRNWIALGLMSLFAAGAVLVYGQGLRGIERYAMDRREQLFEELGKKT